MRHKIELSCLQCGKLFKASNPQRKYCTAECYHLSLEVFDEGTKEVIRYRYDNGQSTTSIARDLKVNASTINRIIHPR